MPHKNIYHKQETQILIYIRIVMSRAIFVIYSGFVVRLVQIANVMEFFRSHGHSYLICQSYALLPVASLCSLSVNAIGYRIPIP